MKGPYPCLQKINSYYAKRISFETTHKYDKQVNCRCMCMCILPARHSHAQTCLHRLGDTKNARMHGHTDRCTHARMHTRTNARTHARVHTRRHAHIRTVLAPSCGGRVADCVAQTADWERAQAHQSAGHISSVSTKAVPLSARQQCRPDSSAGPTAVVAQKQCRPKSSFGTKPVLAQ